MIDLRKTGCPMCEETEDVTQYGCNACGYYAEDAHAIRERARPREEEQIRKDRRQFRTNRW